MDCIDKEDTPGINAIPLVEIQEKCRRLVNADENDMWISFLDPFYHLEGIFPV